MSDESFLVEHDPLLRAIKQGLLQNDVFLVSVGVGNRTTHWHTCQTIEKVYQYLNSNSGHWEKLRDHPIVRQVQNIIGLNRVNRYQYLPPFKATYAEWKRIQANLQ